MKKSKVISVVTALIMATSALALTGCDNGKKTSSTTERKVEFTYPTVNYVKDIGDLVNDETGDIYNDITYKPVTGMRDDFIKGVDASMVLQVEESGGVYFNSEGAEQDVFQIMAESGVNFFRVRVWNDPYRLGQEYGGGTLDTERAVELALRAEKAGMNVLVDYHYSDFWADPDNQELPKAWASKSESELISAVGDFTKESLNEFKDAGVSVDMVQIGNEINNGMLYPTGKINWTNPDSSFQFLAKAINSGISATNSVFPNAFTAVHLANGGNASEFDAFFTYLEKYGCNYEVIGASYYPFYHGTIDNLKANLDATAEKFKKPVYVAEVSWGFTLDSNNYTANTYNSSYEDAGGYLTSVQAQATALSDVMQAIAEVPNSRGLGLFYWEPAWLPVQGASWANKASGRTDSDGLATWSNQGLFSYSGKALPSLKTFKEVSSAVTVEEKPKNYRYNKVEYTLNTAANERLPETVKVITNLDAIRDSAVRWNAASIGTDENGNYKVGEYEVNGRVNGVSGNITATVHVIENFIKDSGFEEQGATDAIIAPWVVNSSSPAGEKVVKLDRKTDMRTGKTNLNWYHGSKDLTFDVSQKVTLDSATYVMTSYCMADTVIKASGNYVIFYIKDSAGKVYECDITQQINGWGSKDTHYVPAVIEAELSGEVEIGVKVKAPKSSWGHIDDFQLVKKSA